MLRWVNRVLWCHDVTSWRHVETLWRHMTWYDISDMIFWTRCFLLLFLTTLKYFRIISSTEKCFGCVKSKDWLFIKRNCKPNRNCKPDRNRWVSLILLRFTRPQCLAATHLSSPEVGNGLNWPKPQCTCNSMVTSQAQHSTNEGVLRSNSACSMLMSDDLRLPRQGIEPQPRGSEPSTLPLGRLPSSGKSLGHPLPSP